MFDVTLKGKGRRKKGTILFHLIRITSIHSHCVSFFPSGFLFQWERGEQILVLSKSLPGSFWVKVEHPLCCFSEQKLLVAHQGWELAQRWELAGWDQDQTCFHFPSTVLPSYSPTWARVKWWFLQNCIIVYLHASLHFLRKLLGSHLEIAGSFSSTFHDSLKQSFTYILKRGIDEQIGNFYQMLPFVIFREQYLLTLPSHYLYWVLFICHVQ